MPVIGPRTFERRLRSIEDQALAAFVADLWAARGRETTRHGTLVTTRDTGSGRVEVLRCSSRWYPLERDTTAVDAIVTGRSGRVVDRIEADSGVRVIDPTDLRELLLYAIDRDTASNLYTIHFDRPLESDGRSAGLSTRWPALRRRTVLGAGVVFVTLLGMVLVGMGHYGASDNGPTVSADVVSSRTDVLVDPPNRPGGDGTSVTIRTDNGLDQAYPPGLDSTGIADIHSLAAAHRSILANESFDLLIVHRGTNDVLHPDRRWVSSLQIVTLRGESRYRYRVSGLERTGPETFESHVYEDYGDGTANLRRIAAGEDIVFQRSQLPRHEDGGPFVHASTTYVQRYLATTETQVELVEDGDEIRYRVIATETPTQLEATASNYTALAIIDQRGMVQRMSVQFTHADRLQATTPGPPRVGLAEVAPSSGRATVYFWFSFRRTGDVTVASPEWYERALVATNATALAPWPNNP